VASQLCHQSSLAEAFAPPAFVSEHAQTRGGSSSASNAPLQVIDARARSTSLSGQRRCNDVLIPGLASKRPARPSSRQRASSVVAEAFPLSAAFQEFFAQEQEAQELGKFVRSRSVTPPPCDFLHRALRGEASDSRTVTFHPMKTIAEPSIQTLELSQHNPSSCEESKLEPRSTTDSRSDQRHGDQVMASVNSNMMTSSKSSAREKSPCFGSEEPPRNIELQQSVPMSPQKSVECQMKRLGVQTTLQAMVRPARQAPRVRRQIRASPSRSRQSLTTCGRTRLAASRTKNCDESHSISCRRSRTSMPNISNESESRARGIHLRRSFSCSGVPHIEPASPPETHYSEQVASLAIPPQTDTGKSDEAIEDAEVCEDKAPRETSEITPHEGQSEPPGIGCAQAKGKGKGKGKGKAPPPPPKGLAAPPKPKAASTNGKIDGIKTRAVSEGPWYHGRPLYWRELPGAGEGSHSIFDKSLNRDSCDHSPGFGFDWDECDELFGSRTDKSDSLARRATAPDVLHAQGRVKDEPLVCVLSQRQATSCSIVLRAIDDLAGVSRSLQNLEFEAISEDVVGRLRDLVDSVEETHVKQLRELSKQISECGGDELRVPARITRAFRGSSDVASETRTRKLEPNLRDIERKLLPLFDIERVDFHVRLAQISYTFEAQRTRICSASEAFAKASQEIRNSKALKDFIDAAVSLRDYVQHGPQALRDRDAPARAMDIGSLLSGMREYKAAGPDSKKISLLVFFARSLLRMRPDFDAELVRELPSLVENRSLTSSGESPWPALYDSLSQLRADVSFASSELADHAGAYQDSGVKRLGTLIDALKNANVEASEAMGSTTAALEELGRYFGVPGAREPVVVDKVPAVSRKDPSGIRILCQVATLLTGFRHTCAQVRELHPDGRKARSVSPRFRNGSLTKLKVDM